MTQTTLKSIDHTALKTNQAAIILFLIAGYILNFPPLIGIVAFFMLAGTALGRPGFGWIYAAFRRAGMLKPDLIEDNPEPHRFAQGFGGTVVLAGFISLLAGAAGLGWGLAWLVVALAALNLFAGFCMGCAVYYWLGRLRFPGFVKAPPPGTFPGVRPRRQQS